MHQSLNIELSSAVAARWQSLCEQSHMAPDRLAAQLIEEFVGKMGDADRSEEDRICEERWSHYKQSGEFVSQEEMDAWFNRAIAESKRKAGEA